VFVWRPLSHHQIISLEVSEGRRITDSLLKDVKVNSSNTVASQQTNKVQCASYTSKLLTNKHKVMAARSWAPKGLLEFVGATKILLKGGCSHKNQLVLRRIPVGKKCEPFSKVHERRLPILKVAWVIPSRAPKCVAKMVAGCDEGCCNVWVMLNNLLDKARQASIENSKTIEEEKERIVVLPFEAAVVTLMCVVVLRVESLLLLRCVLWQREEKMKSFYFLFSEFTQVFKLCRFSSFDRHNFPKRNF